MTTTMNENSSDCEFEAFINRRDTRGMTPRETLLWLAYHFHDRLETKRLTPNSPWVSVDAEPSHLNVANIYRKAEGKS